MYALINVNICIVFSYKTCDTTTIKKETTAAVILKLLILNSFTIPLHATYRHMVTLVSPKTIKLPETRTSILDIKFPMSIIEAVS